MAATAPFPKNLYAYGAGQEWPLVMRQDRPGHSCPVHVQYVGVQCSVSCSYVNIMTILDLCVVSLVLCSEF